MIEYRLNDQLTQAWEQAPKDQRLLVAYAGDTHLLRSSETRPNLLEGFPSPEWAFERFGAVLHELMELAVKPQLLILGGDMTDTAEVGEWDRVFELLQIIDIPYLLTIGNHDHEGAVDCPWYQRTKKALSARNMDHSQVQDFWCHQADVGAYRFVILDSLETGELVAAQHDFLARALATNRPTVISCHRPTVETGNWMDEHRLIDKAYVDRLSKSENVIAVLSGHTHKSCTVRLANAWHLVSPAVCYGIEDGTGYRLLCLADGEVAWTALRMMPGPSVQDFNGPVVQQDGSFSVEPLDAPS